MQKKLLLLTIISLTFLLMACKAFTHTEYYQGGTIKYTGGWKAGHPHGQGKEYNQNGSLVYEGGYNFGNKDGRGTIYFPDGTISYTGEFKNNVYHGNGTLNYRNGHIKYTGGWVDGLYQGKGTLYDARYAAVSEGEFVKGVLHGEGTYTYVNLGKGYVYERVGIFNNGSGVGTTQEGISNNKEYIDYVKQKYQELKKYGKVIDDDETMLGVSNSSTNNPK